MTVHFIYAKGNRISTPNAITNEVDKRLSDLYNVKLYNWDDQITIYPEEGDILLGHPHEWRKTVFKQSMKNKGWSKIIMICPYHHGVPTFAVYDDCYKYVDVFLVITGEYWFDNMCESIFSHWCQIAKLMDLAVNRGHFPFIKNRFSPIGRRKFLYIGSMLKYKGTDYLLKLIKANPQISFGWIGLGNLPEYNNLIHYGVLDTSLDSTRDIIKEYDFLITTGSSDPNPTTILEAAAWGLIPVCTRESGYYEDNWIFNIPLDDLKGASKRIELLNNLPEEKLIGMQKNEEIVLENKYNWNIFTNKIIAAIEYEKPAKIGLSLIQNIMRIYIKIVFLFLKTKDKTWTLFR